MLREVLRQLEQVKVKFGELNMFTQWKLVMKMICMCCRNPSFIVPLVTKCKKTVYISHRSGFLGFYGIYVTSSPHTSHFIILTARRR